MTFIERFSKERREGEETPYDRIKAWISENCSECGVPPLAKIGHEPIIECLNYMLATGNPLPSQLTVSLILDFELALSGHDADLIKKRKGSKSKSTHSFAEIYESSAASYVQLCAEYDKACKESGEKNDMDNTYVKTICDACGVTLSTIYRWKAKFPYDYKGLSKEELEVAIWEATKELECDLDPYLALKKE